MQHIIKKQILNLEIPSNTDSWKISDQFTEVYNRDVLPKLEQICNQMGFARDFTFKLDSLTIDTGDILESEITDTWVQAIETGFRKELEQYKNQKLNSEEKQLLISPEQSDLQVLFHFLENGVLPWYVPQQYKQTPQTLLKKLLDEQPKALISLIKLSKAKASISQRLIHQFNHDQVRTLLQHFKTPDLAKAIDWISIEIRKVMGIETKAFDTSLLLVKTVLTFDENTLNKNEEWLFTLIFQQVLSTSISSIKQSIKSIHKHLKNSVLINKRELTHKAENYYQSAIHSIESVLNKSDIKVTKSDLSKAVSNTQSSSAALIEKHETSSLKTKTGNSTDTKTGTSTDISEKDEIRETKEKLFNSVIPSASLEEKPDHSQVQKEQNKPSNKTQESLTQDQRVWEHLQRIKKAQLEKPIVQNAAESTAPENPTLTSDDSFIAMPNRLTRATVPSESKETPSSQVSNTQEADFSTNTWSEVGHKSKNKTAQNDAPSKNISEDDESIEKYWQNEPDTIDECYIQNAGLILLWPYLGHFFDDLGLLEDGSFTSKQQQNEAVLTLQCLLAKEPEFDEYRLPLNKLLCGLPISESVSNQLQSSQKIEDNCEKLLDATIKNWGALRGTSIEGFQSTFLNRNGVLKKHENHWQLQVEKMAFDMLLEHLPWPLSIVRLSWMDKPIYVEW